MTYYLFQTLPTSFIPNEDQGYFFVIVQGPSGVSTSYTNKVVAQIEKVMLQTPKIVGTFAISGWSFTGNSPNSGFVVGTLKPWKERPGKDSTLDSIITRVSGPLSKITGRSIRL